MSTTLTKKNIIVGTDAQIQARYANDPEGTIYLSTTGTTVPSATSTSGGIVKLGSDTVQSEAAQTVSSTTDRTYAIQLNGSGQMVVNVPWSSGSSTVTIDTTSGSEYVSDGTNTLNVMTRDTAQTITAAKTFQGTNPILIVKQPSSGSGSSIRPTLQLQNSSGSEVGYFQYHTTNNQIVFGANENSSADIQLALRQYKTSGAYSVKLPLCANKTSAIGSGDITMPLGVKVGSSSVITATSGGLIELPAYPDEVEANPTVPSGTTPTSLTGLRVGTDYYQISGGGGGGTGKYFHTITIAGSGSSGKHFHFTYVDTVQNYSAQFAQNAFPAQGSDLYNLFDTLGLTVSSMDPTITLISPIIGEGSSVLYFRPGYGFVSFDYTVSSSGSIAVSAANNISQAGAVTVQDISVAI